MFKKAIEAVVKDGIEELRQMEENSKRAIERAAEIVATRKSEIEALVVLAKEVPEKVFDRYSNILICEFPLHSQNAGRMGDIGLRLNGYHACLHGIMGPDDFKPGKYRAVVLLERMGD